MRGGARVCVCVGVCTSGPEELPEKWLSLCDRAEAGHFSLSQLHPSHSALSNFPWSCGRVPSAQPQIPASPVTVWNYQHKSERLMGKGRMSPEQMDHGARDFVVHSLFCLKRPEMKSWTVCVCSKLIIEPPLFLRASVFVSPFLHVPLGVSLCPCRSVSFCVCLLLCMSFSLSLCVFVLLCISPCVSRSLVI